MENTEFKTPYDWCVEINMRILSLQSIDEKWYYTKKVNNLVFLEWLNLQTVKPNSMPRKTEMFLEYRMYGLVPYNLSPIQQGIQFGHAVVDYARTLNGIEPFERIYNKWADTDKTFIILNGGTTNNNPEKLGSLNQHMESLKDNGIPTQGFYEPDLGDQLTAFVFLVDERVFNRTLYPDFEKEVLPWSRTKPSEKAKIELAERNNANYDKWVEKVGGWHNVFLRDFLRDKRLA